MVNGLMPGIPFCFERWQNLDFQAQSFNADRLEAPRQMLEISGSSY